MLINYQAQLFSEFGVIWEVGLSTKHLLGRLLYTDTIHTVLYIIFMFSIYRESKWRPGSWHCHWFHHGPFGGWDVSVFFHSQTTDCCYEQNVFSFQGQPGVYLSHYSFVSQTISCDLTQSSVIVINTQRHVHFVGNVITSLEPKYPSTKTSSCVISCVSEVLSFVAYIACEDFVVGTTV